ncbi:acetoin biosynthesis transcriptional regulator AlsR [Sporolactobacillus inulinus]|jgi:DNA-binding transcriptional LysR family regulator|uniref:LysR family transcriptional regulator n=1 Tax=Sporolactobacillus inulinus CASD TaxID=1069536 RepID=A0A0U1QR26_9BACL|nr:LysR family transcriptional regulator [Sporolactobacillus inulinus]KLI03251.1 LysR family transcriptional regulator [Sporolactobacillus inulinus CASD]GEB76783.1 LysR family transcriptional regulator [Sporolactobacillus inulinus]
MELRHFLYFIAVAEELHFGRAAARLQMTQPPLSKQIQQFEEEIGVPLFKRNKRHVELTTAGQLFLPEARQIIAQVNQAVDTAQRADRGEFGRLVIGFVGSATYDILPQIIREYRRKFPHVSIRLHELSTPDQVNALIGERIDVGLLHPPVSSSFIDSIPIKRGFAALSLPKNHPLAKKEHIYIEDLQDIPFILVSRDIWPGLYDEFLSLFQSVGFTPRIVQEATEYQMVVGLVSAGIGIGVVPATAEKLFNLEVVYRQIDNYPLTAILSLAYLKKNTNPALKQFVSLTKRIRIDE